MSKCTLGGRDGDQEEVPYVYLVKFSLQFTEEITVVGNVRLKHKADFLKTAIDQSTGSQVLVRPARQRAGQSAPCVVSVVECALELHNEGVDSG